MKKTTEGALFMEKITNTTGLINTLLPIINNVPLIRELVISRNINHLSHQVLHLFNNQALLGDPTTDVFIFLFGNFCKIHTVKFSGAFSLIHTDLFLIETKFHFWWLYFSYKILKMSSWHKTLTL